MPNISVYVNAMGAYLPGPKIPNEEMEKYLGLIGGKPSKVKSLVLRQNRIHNRHYAMDAEGRFTHTVSELAANAVRVGLQRWEGRSDQIDFLVAATSQADTLIPGFANSVHAEMKLHPCEISSAHGVCASGLIALRQAQWAIQTGSHRTAVACAGEFASRFFRPAFLDVLAEVIDGARADTDVEFLRWMLSDGGGSAILEAKPNERGLSLKVDWINLNSYASQYPTCMYAGGRKDKQQGELTRFWYQYPTLDAAVRDGALTLRQDMRLLDNIVKLGVRRYFELIDEKKIDPKRIDWMVCHYSSHHFFEQIQTMLKNTGGYIPEDRWFTNLYETGNVGSASLFVNLEELLYSGKLKVGDRVLCMIPESSRFTVGFAQFTVTDAAAEAAKRADTHGNPTAPVMRSSTGARTTTHEELQAEALRGLAEVWGEFSSAMRMIPFIDQMQRGALRMQDYRDLLMNMRQQVIEGSRWIARAASSMTSHHAGLRSLFIGHAKEEHRDYEMLERDFVALGGTLDEIQNGEKNVGSEALASWMFQKASEANPFGLLGAMFIIEGLGKNFAETWAIEIKKQLGLTDDQISFFLYHGRNDEDHMEKFHEALGLLPLTEQVVKDLVKTARVTGELYALQLRKIGHY